MRGNLRVAVKFRVVKKGEDGGEMMVSLGGTIRMMEAGGDKDGYVKIWFVESDDPFSITKALYRAMGSPQCGTTWKITIEDLE